MAILAWPAVEWGGGALLGWLTSDTAIVAGSAVVAGTATGVAVNKIRNQGQTQAAAGSPDPCPTCKPKDKEKCQSLENGIKNKIKEIEGKRTYGLQWNPKSQPWDFPGAKPSQTVLGHVGLFQAEQGALVKDMNEFERLNCGKMPDGAMAAAMKEIPGNAGLLGQ